MKTTDELLKVLKNSKNIEHFIQENFDDVNDATFTQYLNKYLTNCGMTKSAVIDKSNIQKNYCYQMHYVLQWSYLLLILTVCLNCLTTALFTHALNVIALFSLQLNKNVI